MPRLLSTEGPALATADVNGDGLDDLYVGGAMWQPGTLLRAAARRHLPAGAHSPRSPRTASPRTWTRRSSTPMATDIPICTSSSGGNAVHGPRGTDARPTLPQRRPRPLRTRDATRSPSCTTTAACVAAGRLRRRRRTSTLFSAVVSVPGKYGVSPKSHLLRNDGTGRFTDVTLERAPGLVRGGDGHLGGLGGLRRRLAARPGGRRRVDARTRLPSGAWAARRSHRAGGTRGHEGWWSAVVGADVNGRRQAGPRARQPRTQLVRHRVARREPARLYVGDFAHNGTLQQILTTYKQRRELSDRRTRRASARRSRRCESRYPDVRVVRREHGRGHLRRPPTSRKARKLRGAHVRQRDRGERRQGEVRRCSRFHARRSSPRSTRSLADDFDGDGRMDLLLGGNFHGVPPILGRYDASYGLLLRGSRRRALRRGGHGAERRADRWPGAPHAHPTYGARPIRCGRTQRRRRRDAAAGRAAAFETAGDRTAPSSARSNAVMKSPC